MFGVAWSPANEKQFLTGCRDTKVRLFDVTVQEPVAVRVFSGHQDRVYNVLYNPQIPNIFVSGADDRSIKVWDQNSDKNTAV